MFDYDVLVLGGGPGGYVAAIRAAQRGLRTCLVEKEELGGVCLNRGCIPTKTLLKTAEVYHTVQQAADFAVLGVARDALQVDMAKLQQRKKRVVKKLTGGVKLLLKNNGVSVLAGEGVFQDAHTLMVNGAPVSAAEIIIATGSAPASLPVSIAADAQVIDSDGALALSELPPRIAIVGGGVIGVEFAYLLRQLGSEVEIIEFLPRILSMVDAEIAEQAALALQKAGIRLHTGARVTEIDAAGVVFIQDGETQRVDAPLTLVATGRKPCLDGYGLEHTGVATERGAIVTDSRLRTNIPHIHAIGDVNGKSMLAHTASMEGLVAVADICGEPREMSYAAIPSCIYIQPEIAACGMTEDEARQHYGDLLVGRFPLAANGKATVEGVNEGMIKLIIRAADHVIVGAHLRSIHATDMIGGIAALIEAGMTAEQAAETVFPHPTVSEIIPEAFHAALGKAIHSA